MPPVERLPDGAQRVDVLVILPDGQVQVRTAVYYRDRARRRLLTFAPGIPAIATLGFVDPDESAAWIRAGRIARAAGWQLVGQWTTVRRMPTVRVRPPLSVRRARCAPADERNEQ